MNKILSMLMLCAMMLTLFASGALAADADQVIYVGGTTEQTAETSGYDLAVSKMIEAVEGKENFFDITLTATTHRHTVDTSTDVVVVLDYSGTMNDQTMDTNDGDRKKIANAKEAAQIFLSDYADDQSLTTKRFGFVTFNENAKALVSLTEINGSNSTKVQNMLSTIGGLADPPKTPSEIQYTNIEGGLQLAHNMLKGSQAKYKYVILISDGFPTTYIESGRDNTEDIYGYNCRMGDAASVNKYGSFYRADLINTEGYFANISSDAKAPCYYGVDYSNRGAQKAEDVAKKIKAAGINVFSVGIDIGSMTISDSQWAKYQNPKYMSYYSTIDTTGMSQADITAGNYVIGDPDNTDSYISWLTNDIAGGPHLGANQVRYLSGDNAEEFRNSVDVILKMIEIIPRTQMREFFTLDPMGDNIEFLHFFDKDGNKAGSELTGESKQNAEDTAKYGGTNNSDRINWNLIQSGFKMDGENFVFDIKYRIRLENENASYTTGFDQLTNGTTTLEYHSVYEDGSSVPNGDGELEYKVPKVEGYHGSLKFLKQDEETKEPLANAEFTLTHFGTACSVCGGEAPISPIVKKTNSSGVLEMTNIPSGHEYRLHESGVPNGYTATTNHTVIVSYGKTYIDQKTDAQLLENGKFVNQSGDPSFVIYNSKAEPVEMKIQLKKTLDGRTMKAGEFSFQIAGKDQNGSDYREIKTNAADGTVTFDKMAFSVPGTYTYTITEVPGSDDTIVYDEAAHTVKVVVENKHDADSTVNKEHYVAKVSVDGGKATEYIGQENVVETIQIANAFTNSVRRSAEATITANKLMLNANGGSANVPAGKFAFLLQGVGEGNAVAAAEYCGANGVASFGPLTYTEPGVYKYTLREVTDASVLDPNYVYDTHVYDVTVTVSAPSDLTDDAALSAVVSYSQNGEAKDKAEFTNRERKQAQMTLSAVKTMNGAAPAANAFEFELVEIGANNAENVIATVKNDADGKISFPQMIYDADDLGSHLYIIREKIGTDGTIVYDETEYYVNVTVTTDSAQAYALDVIVTKSADGKTTFVGEANGSELEIALADAFANVSRRPGSAKIQAIKLLQNANGQALAPIANRFQFKLTGDGNVNQTVYSGASGFAIFDEITYTTPGVYSYKLSEIAGTDANYTYDAKVYDVTVTATADGTGIATQVAYSLNGAAQEKAEFINNRNQGDLTVSKTVVSSIESDKTIDFSFTVTLGDTSISGVYGDMTFAEGKATFTLKDGQSKTATGLPAGVEYAVTEASMGRFVTTKTGETGAIPAGGTATAAFTNTNTTGSLVVTKTVNSPYEPDMTKEFGFIVELDNKNVNGTYGEMTFNEGVAIFALKHGESKTAYRLPAGVNYTVIEGVMDDAGNIHGYKDEFNVTYTNDEGSIGSNEQATVSVTNERKKGALKITKHVTSAEDADKTKEFEFTVELVGSNSNHTHGSFRFVNGVAEVKLKDGESAQADDLPVGVTFIVKEKIDDDFVTTMTGSTSMTFDNGNASASGKITTAMDEVVYTNTRKTGGLMISKEVESPSDEDNTRSFRFSISLDDKTITGTYGDVEFASGEGTFMLQAGQTVSINGLPADTAYAVTEETDAHFDTTAQLNGATANGATISGTIQNNNTIRILFVNTHKSADLTLTKKVDSPYAVDSQRKFNFTVTLSDRTINDTFGDMTFANGVARVVLEHGVTKTATGLPVGIDYTVTEDEANENGFITTSTGETGTITENSTAAVEFTNTRNVTAGLRIHKDVDSDNPADQRQQFQVMIELDDATIDGKHGDITFDKGKATVTLTGDSFLFASGLTPETGFTVTELNTENDGFGTTVQIGVNGQKTPGNTATGTLMDQAVIDVLFTNTRDKGDLTVQKTVESPIEADKDKLFTFMVKLGADIDKTYKDSQNNDVTFTDGEAVFTLKHGESKTITGLPVGLGYTVSETKAEGFTTTHTGSVGTIMTQNAPAVFTNTRENGELIVRKIVEGGVNGDNTKKFGFTVTLNPAISGTFGGVKFENGVTTFELAHGESKRIVGLPLTIGYTVTEAAEELFTVDANDQTGTITAIASEKVFTNRRISDGSLVVSKEVVSANPADLNQKFTFMVELSARVNGDYTGQIGNKTETVTFTNGVASFELTHGESMVISGLPVGLGYTVSEMMVDGFTARVDGTNGVISADGSAQVKFTNTRDTGSLTVKKTVIGGVNGDNTKKFKFTVTLKQEISNTFSGVRFENGVATIELAHGQTKTISDLPIGVEYTVTEETDDLFTTTWSGETGTISKSQSVAAFTNTRVSDGSLTISKKVVSDYPADKEQVFQFTIKLSAKVNGTYSKVEFKDGVATVELKGGESKVIENLPTNLGYEVTEATVANFTTESKNATGTIPSQGNALVEFTNTRETGDLTVKKVVVGGVNGDNEKKFQFTVTLTPAIAGTYGDVTFDENGAATFGLANGESKTITGLPVGVKYEVVEAADELFATTKTGETGTISTTASEAVFTNTRVSDGSLTISKKVVSDYPADKDQVFQFTIKLSAKVNGTYSEVEFKDGVATIELKGGEAKTIENLPTNLGYEVTEATVANFTTESKNATGTIPSQGNALVEFTNTRETGDLTVKKVVVGGVNGDNEKKFQFTVTLTPAIAGTYGDVTFNENGVATFVLANGEIAKITGLPVGVKYEVVEAADELFATTKTGETGTISTTASEAVFTNTRVSDGSLTISKKVVSDYPADKDQEFTFEIELSAKVNGTYSEVEFKDGKAEITLKGGESKVIEGLPTGLGYTVTEATNNAFNVTYENERGTIPAQNETGVVVMITNARKTTDLTIRKTVESSFEADKSQSFKFEIDLNADIDKTYSDVAFVDGKATVELKHGEEKKIEGLPIGLTCAVIEVRANGFDTKVNGVLVEAGNPGAQAVLDADAAKNVVEFVNIRKVSGDNDPLVISKKVNSAIASDLTMKFEFTIELSDPTVNGTYAAKNHLGEETQVTFENGKAIVTLADGESISITDLPIGVTSKVTEKPVTGFSTAVNNEAKNELTQTLVSGGIMFSFVNERAVGGENETLTISKTVVSPLKSDDEKTFMFQVELADKTISGLFEAVHTSAAGSKTLSIQIADGLTKYPLKGGEKLTIKGLPIGMGYTVTEETADGFMTTSTGASGMINKDAAAVAAFTNTRMGSQMLTVSKTVVGDASSEEDVFTFEIRVADLKDGQYGDMAFVGGVATVQLKHGQKAVAKGIPVGAAYTVTETDYGNYTPNVLSYEGVMTAQGAEAAFVNALVKPNLPETGDSSKLALWCAMLALAGAGIVMLKRRTA